MQPRETTEVPCSTTAMNAPDATTPRLIVGMARAATTWLCKCLNVHSEVVAFGESLFWGRRFVAPGPDGRYEPEQVESIRLQLRGGGCLESVLGDGAGCPDPVNFPMSACSFAMYVTVDCGSSLNIPMDDIENNEDGFVTAHGPSDQPINIRWHNPSSQKASRTQKAILSHGTAPLRFPTNMSAPFTDSSTFYTVMIDYY